VLTPENTRRETIPLARPNSIATKGAKKRAVGMKGIAEGKKQRRARLLKVARTSSDPRQRMWALAQLDEMSVAAAQKDGVGVLLKGAAKREQIARLTLQASSSDPVTRFRAQDQLRGLRRI
jgi:hypothetical protein